MAEETTPTEDDATEEPTGEDTVDEDEGVIEPEPEPDAPDEEQEEGEAEDVPPGHLQAERVAQSRRFRDR